MEGFKMANKKNKEKTESNLFNFRTKTISKCKEFKRRKRQLPKKAKHEEIYEDGLLVHEGRELEGTILNLKAKKIAEREKLLAKLNGLNHEIQAHNLRLIDLYPSRYEKDYISDNVLYFKVFDKHEKLKYEFKLDKDLLK